MRLRDGQVVNRDVLTRSPQPRLSVDRVAKDAAFSRRFARRARPTYRERIIFRKVVIAAHRELVVVNFAWIEFDEIVRQIRIEAIGWRRRERLQYFGERRDTIRRDDVARERLTRAVGAGGQWVVDDRFNPVVINEIAQVAPPHRRRRGLSVISDAALTAAQPFIRGEPEGFVASVEAEWAEDPFGQPERAARRDPKFIANQFGRFEVHRVFPPPR